MTVILIIAVIMVLGLALHFGGKDGKVSGVGFEMFRIALAALFLFLIFTKGAWS